MKYIFSLFFFVLLTVSVFAQEQLPTYGVFVGINNYLHTNAEKGFSNLNYARHDAEALADQFKRIEAKKVITLTDSDARDYAPTAKNILKVLKEIKDEKEAVTWFRKAAEQGHGDAKKALERLEK
jgi:hypothetical protein